MYAISRSQAKLGVFFWEVHFRRRGKSFNKGFFDLNLGGPKKALKAAIAWRDRQLEKARVLTKHEFCRVQRSNKTSGVPGVIFQRRENQPKGNWQASVKLPGAG